MFGIKKEELVWSVFFFFNFMTFSCLGIVEAEPFVTETKTVKETPQVTNNKRKFPDDREIRIAWMAPEAEYHNFSAATSVGTLKMGLSFIENEKSLHGRTIR